MRKTIITLVVAVASLVPAWAGADGMPPTAGKTGEKGAPAAPGSASKVTMSDLQADAPDSYTVVKGDTLAGFVDGCGTVTCTVGPAAPELAFLRKLSGVVVAMLRAVPSNV